MASNSKILDDFASYPFDQDPNFQDGLEAILAQDTTGLDSESMIGRAKAFYYSSVTGQTVDWDDYVAYKNEKLAASPEKPKGYSDSSSSGPDTKTLTFAEITALIESGQTHLIPNNETIPQGLNEAMPSISTQPRRLKPWETADESPFTDA